MVAGTQGSLRVLGVLGWPRSVGVTVPEFEPLVAGGPPRSDASVVSARRSAAKRASEERDALEASAAPTAVLGALRSPGEPLEAGVRSSFEHSMGCDFSLVRVHSDQVAATSAVRARAFTVGDHIVVKHRLDPLSPSDDRLLSHELAHVVDQRGGSRKSLVLQRQPDDEDRAQRARRRKPLRSEGASVPTRARTPTRS